MHLRSPVRTWARWTLMFCLLLLSAIAPLWWTGKLQPPPRRLRPIEGFTITPVPYETTPVAPVAQAEDHWVEAPDFLPVARAESPPQQTTTELTDAHESRAPKLPYAQSRPLPTS